MQGGRSARELRQDRGLGRSRTAVVVALAENVVLESFQLLAVRDCVGPSAAAEAPSSRDDGPPINAMSERSVLRGVDPATGVVGTHLDADGASATVHVLVHRRDGQEPYRAGRRFARAATDGDAGRRRSRRSMIRATPTAALLLAMLAAGCRSAAAPPSSDATVETAISLSVDGDLPDARTFSLPDLAALGAVDVPWEHDGERHVLHGVAVDLLLQACGFGEGPGGRSVPRQARRPGWRRALLAVGVDGYATAFSCAEVSTDMGPTRAYVCWRVDDAACPDGEGPLRLVVVTDRKGARGVRSLARLTVVDLSRFSGFATEAPLDVR